MFFLQSLTKKQTRPKGEQETTINNLSQTYKQYSFKIFPILRYIYEKI